MPSLEVLLLRLLLVIVVGGLIGAEREYRNKSAGFRTMILICLGSFLFTSFSIAIGGTDDRIASNIVTGIGFIGGGVIFRSGIGINGLTTAASIWIVAALGMGIADGYYTLVLISTALVLLSLFLFLWVERWMASINRLHQYKMSGIYTPRLLPHYEALFTECGLRYKRSKHIKSGDRLSGVWVLEGNKAAHKRFVERMLNDKDTLDFNF